MKKLLTSFALLVSCGLLLPGCLKDKGFDDNEYGINLNEGSPAAVAFLKGGAPLSTFGVNVDPGAQIIPLTIQYTGETAPSSDITVSVTLDNTIVTAYNTANSTNLVIFPAANLSVPATMVIPAGKRFADLEVKILNTVPLSPNIQYAFAVKIASASGGAKLTTNLNQVLAGVTIKNKYDGVYRVTGSYVEPANATATSTYPKTYEIVTTGANSIDIYNLVNGAFVPGYTFQNSTGSFFFGSFGVSVIFNTTTDAVVETRNYYGDPTKAVTSIGNPSTGSGAPNYASAGNIRRAILDPTGINKYNPATKTVDIKYTLNQGGVLRGIMTEQWVYTGPR